MMRKSSPLENRPPGDHQITAPRQFGSGQEPAQQRGAESPTLGAQQEPANNNVQLLRIEAKLDELLLRGSAVSLASVQARPQKIRNLLVGIAAYPIIRHGVAPWFTDAIWPWIVTAYEAAKRAIYDLGTK